MHLEIYKKYPNINAIVHTHSPFATGFAVNRQTIPLILIETKPFLGGEIKVAPFKPAGSLELDQAILPYLENANSCLLANHGTISCGKDMEEAYIASTYVEDSAKIYYYAKTSGISLALKKPGEAKPTTFSERVDMYCEGGGEKALILMVIIFILAGAFYGVANAMHAVESITNLGLTILPTNMVLPAVIINLILLSMQQAPSVNLTVAHSFNLANVIPYVLIIVLSLVEMNVMSVITLGVVSGVIIEIIHGDFTLVKSFGIIHTGMTCMEYIPNVHYALCLVLYAYACIWNFLYINWMS